ncbi:MAG: HD-GYP domain-containing protein [Wujia sp.]
MIVLQWCKTQIMCLMILLYIGIVFIKDGNRMNRLTQKTNCNRLFDIMFVLAEFGVFFDGMTAWSVNYLQQIPRTLNIVLHFAMFLCYELFMVALFWYWVSITTGIPKRGWVKVASILPTALTVFFTLLFMPKLEFLSGEYTNYSMGASVYICFGSVGIYCILTIGFIIARYRYILKEKKIALLTTLVFIILIMAMQIIFPECLVSCMACTMVIVSVYINMENPNIHGLEFYHHEMVMGFATLVENKDDSTGGHIRRSSAYAVLIARNLRKNPRYRVQITKDYVENLSKSAPMHDIGKIGIPDEILQKPGKLTDEEYTKMKEHPAIGGKIIQDTFGHLFDGEYANMAFQVAKYHHEKWNGKGYPCGIKGEDIPLCARIMAVADVFDAVSAKRCYRDAMPLEACYEIIEKGRGTDFDPDIVDAFMMNREQVEAIYNQERAG